MPQPPLTRAEITQRLYAILTLHADTTLPFYLTDWPRYREITPERDTLFAALISDLLTRGV